MSNYIKGIDVSNNNSNIDFKKVKNVGVELVYLKSSQGISFTDSTMATYYAAAKAQGLKVGAYHYFTSADAKQQASHFYQCIKDYDWDAIPFLDVESNFDGISEAVVECIDTFKELNPAGVGIYTYTGFLDNIAEAIATTKDLPLWEANYNGKPWTLPTNSYTNRVGHQYSETATVDGVGTCDVDSFNENIYLGNSSVLGLWQMTDRKWWYQLTDGSYPVLKWEKIDNKWYYFDDKGYVIYDWKKDGNTWYHLDSDIGAMQTGWFYDKYAGKWYYADDNGAMQTGWLKSDDDYYYLDHNGAMCTGWIVVDSKDYLLDSSGVMYNNTIAYGYSFDSNGVATKLS